ncbi:patatin-like phospholipase family protein [Aquabacterium sp.]|uniref:patatin-like phospholipase family protein n=1 Tax=Aquabacterium sp. TaxID=1872578 RepID=UPI00199F7663|nr:patatin-like phospholipase family protein [Aquabacterium sp.]MBC7699385.1 patatin-like phospholipase family protein [Aquabacterium sp.]
MRRTFYDIAYFDSIYRTKALLSIVLTAVLAGCATRHVEPPQPAVVLHAPVAKPAPRLPKIGLALGGGAARGFAHIGVLQVLEEQGIKPDLVVGTSAGSVVAALYAAGKTPAELESMAMTLDESTMTDWVFPGRSVMKGEALAKFVRGFTGGRQIEQMAIPLGIVATDLNSGQPILFRRGDPGTAVRASSSVPAVFTPVRIAGREYVDGGLVSPIPVKYARQMGADLVIAVDISAVPEGQPTKGAVDILLQTFNIMGHSISQYELQDADVVMRPRLSGIGSGDFGNRRLSILAGREAALSVLQQLKEKIAAKTR